MQASIKSPHLIPETEPEERNTRTGWASLSPVSRRLLVFGFLIVLVATFAIGLMVWQSYNIALDEARRNVSKLGIAIAEQTARSMQAGDLVMEEIIKQIAAKDVRTVAQFKSSLATEDLFKFLKDRADFLPQIDAFTIIAADGKLVNFSRQYPTPPTDLSDRDYFAYFKQNDVATPFVSAPVKNRGSGEWTAYVVRRVNAPSGEFLGMVLSAIDLKYFQDFFRALTVGAGTTVTLLRNDGTALTSFPPTARIGAVLPASSPWHQIVKTGPDVFLTQGVLAPGMRIVSVHPLGDYPLVINVSVAEWDALGAWSRMGIAAGACTLSALACVAFLIRALLMQFRRLEQSESLLAARNTALEATQARLQAQAIELDEGRTQLATQSATLETALAHINQGLIMIAADGIVAVCNHRAMSMLDLPPALIAARPTFWALIAYQRSIGEFEGFSPGSRQLSLADTLDGPTKFEWERPNGIVLEVETVPMQGGGMVRTFTDITDRRHSESQVKYMAHHDGLTGLVNRTVFQTRVGDQLRTSSEAGGQFAVFYLDLDGFKLVNDTYGHGVGDELLIVAAQRLQSVCRTGDVVARMGGDEFAVIQSTIGSFDQAGELAERMLAAIAKEFQLRSVRCHVSLSIGIAIFPEHGTTSVELLQHADTALYRAKAAGKRTYRLYDALTHERRDTKFLIEQMLAEALPEGQLFLEYQPIVRTQTLEIVRAEALLRWRHPTFGLIAPSDFIPVAESCGLIVPIGMWVLETACAQAATWPDPLAVSINLSPIQFASGDLAGQIEKVLLRTGLPASRLNLEITEGVLIDNTDSVVRTMQKLRSHGVRFSLDDFGTDHAGLAYLRRYPFDVLKIDRSFVQDAAKDAASHAILAAIQAIGIACGLDVVAEGVETETELALVQALGCSHVQGYLTGVPGPPEKSLVQRRQPPRGRLSLVQP